jgi:hypothetical protein
LLDQVADALRTRGYVAALRQANVDWVRRYILFQQVRHPREMGAAEVAGFLEHLGGRTDLPPAAKVEARAALVFLYDVVLGQSLGVLPSPTGLLPEGTGGSLTPRPGAEGPRLLEQLRHVLRVRHYARRTEECSVDWARRFLLFHGKRHSWDVGAPHVEQFLTHLVPVSRPSSSTCCCSSRHVTSTYQCSGTVTASDRGRSAESSRLPTVSQA